MLQLQLLTIFKDLSNHHLSLSLALALPHLNPISRDFLFHAIRPHPTPPLLFVPDTARFCTLRFMIIMRALAGGNNTTLGQLKTEMVISVDSFLFLFI